MNVLLLGAGASKSYSDSPTGERMPIANDFFKTFCNLEISENPFVIIGTIINYIERIKKVPITEYFNGENSIEEFHSEVERDLIQALKSGDPLNLLLPYKTNSELIYLFSSVINEIQNGPRSKSHCNLVKFLSSEDIIITFNWDTLVDRALNDITEWSTDNGYLIVPKKIYRDGWIQPDTSALNENNHPLLLKLHGSTNWITSHTFFPEGELVLSQSSSPETLYVYESTINPFPAYEGRYMEGYEPFSYGYYPPNIPDKGKSAKKDHIFVSFTQRTPWRPEVEGDKSGLTSMPLIIPPVTEKRYDMFGKLFNSLWAKASDALRLADHIIIIGYSFPRTDLQSNELFIKSFLDRNSIPKISIVDPYPQKIVDKFKYDFGIPIENIDVYKSLFSESFDLMALFNR